MLQIRLIMYIWINKKERKGPRATCPGPLFILTELHYSNSYDHGAITFVMSVNILSKVMVWYSVLVFHNICIELSANNT